MPTNTHPSRTRDDAGYDSKRTGSGYGTTSSGESAADSHSERDEDEGGSGDDDDDDDDDDFQDATEGGTVPEATKPVVVDRGLWVDTKYSVAALAHDIESFGVSRHAPPASTPSYSARPHCATTLTLSARHTTVGTLVADPDDDDENNPATSATALQDRKDVERDSFVVNGTRVAGASGYDLVVLAVAEAIHDVDLAIPMPVAKVAARHVGSRWPMSLLGARAWRQQQQ